jgi:hypothetical protein
MRYTIYKESRELVESALNDLGIEWSVVLPPKWGTHEFNKHYEKRLTEYFMKKHLEIVFCKHSCWVRGFS